VSDLASLARERTDLSELEIIHLGLLVADWTLLADLSASDLVLWVPTWNDGGYVALAQVRPATIGTVLPQDLVGSFSGRGRRPLLDLAWAMRAPVREGLERAVPVGFGGRPIGVVAAVRPPSSGTEGRLESMYSRIAGHLEAMIGQGEFPPPGGWSRSPAPPRLGDGLIVLDTSGTVTFASPNAVSAYHRLGLATPLEGAHLARTTARLIRRPGPVDEDLASVAGGRVAGGVEVEDSFATITLRALPLTTNDLADGALVLVRDVTDVRRRDRALSGKDATIREIHHRVKNNLQTVAAILRLQSRRTDDDGARTALSEAVRRVGAIAVVHEVLSVQPGEVVDFDAVTDRVVALVRDTIVPSETVITLQRSGSAGSLPSETATPLAMVVSELAQNSVEHAFPDRPSGTVQIRMSRVNDTVVIEVIDDGVGLPENVDHDQLGLSIVRTLAIDELRGTFEFVTAQLDGASGGSQGSGTHAVVKVPLRGPGRAPVVRGA